MNIWKSKKLKELDGVEIILGQSPSSKSYNKKKNGLPFLQGKAEFGMIYPKPKIFTDAPLKIAESNDLLLSVRAPVGDINLSPYKLCIGRGLAAIRFKKDNPKFYFYWFLKNQKAIESLGVGSTFKAITGEQLKKIEIPVVELSEQTSIANILSTVDEAIQKADEAITKTERIKQAIVKKLFSKDLNSIGIKELGVVSTGKTPSSFDKSLWNGRTPFVTPGDISGSKYVINTERTVSDKGSKVATLLPRNSLMVVCIGSTIGKVALTSKEMITNQQLNSIIINEDKFDANFIYYSFLNSSNLFRALAGTAAVPIINKTLFERFKISFIIDKKEQIRIGGILSRLDEKLLLQQSRKTKLEKIKQGLMDDLLTGNKRVKIN